MLCLPHLSPCPPPHIHHTGTQNSSFVSFNNSSNLVKHIDNRSRENRRLLLWRAYRSISYRQDEEEESSHDLSPSDRLSRFEEAVKLFNKSEYYACHDVLESLWYDSNDPLRTLLHALLQCAVAFHHLFNQNHKGAMMEMGEGVCKLRKLNFEAGPFHQFEQEMSTVLNFIYQTQLELAACNEDFCVAMGQDERSYQLLEGYGAGQRLYVIDQELSNEGHNGIISTYIVFDPQISYGATGVPSSRVKLPILQATPNHLMVYMEL